MDSFQPPDVLLFLSSHCPQCPSVLTGLVDLLKRGRIGRLEAVNLDIQPEAATALGVRAVPWTRIGLFELSGLRSPQELAKWAHRAGSADGLAEGFHALLKEGALASVLAIVARQPSALAALLPILANPDASLNVRIGAGVVFEEHANSAALHALLPALGELSQHPDARVRADACHTLGLTGHPDARSWLNACLEDLDPEVREIASDSLADLSSCVMQSIQQG